MKYSKNLMLGIIAATLVHIYIGYRVLLNYNPQLAYEWITGNEIPKGVVAVSYGALINDNLIHSSHYWEFSHSEIGLFNLLSQLGTGKEYEDYENATNYQGYDAIWLLSDIETALGKKIEKNVIGKSYEIPGENNRDSWLLVNKVGDRSYYELN